MHARTDPRLSYRQYLALDRLLDCQHPESARRGTPAHDEMLFITTHQTYELWFKQILFELDAVQAIFAREPIPERDVGQAVRGLSRVSRSAESRVRLPVAAVPPARNPPGPAPRGSPRL